MKRYTFDRTSYGIDVYENAEGGAPNGEYVPAEVAERLYEALKEIRDYQIAYGWVPPRLIEVANEAIEFADGETPTT